MDPIFIVAIIYVVYRILVKGFFIAAEYYRQAVNKLIQEGTLKQDINGQLYYTELTETNSDDIVLTIEKDSNTYLGYVNNKFVCQSNVLEELVLKVQALYPTKKVTLIDNM